MTNEEAVRWRDARWRTCLSGAAALVAAVDDPAAAAVRALLHDDARRVPYGAWPGDVDDPVDAAGRALLLLAALAAEQAGRVAALERQVERLAARLGQEQLARSALAPAPGRAEAGGATPSAPAPAA